MRKRIKSRKGMTLVELVVTVAILGIVSGISLTIVVSAMNNYSEAAIISKEENVALLLEENIVRNARVARTVDFIDTSSGGSVPDGAKLGFYVAKIDDVVESFDYDEDSANGGIADTANAGKYKHTRLTYEGIKKITFSIERQKSKKRVSDTSTKLYAYYLNYTIEMNSGYTLKGQTIMNNADVDAMKPKIAETDDSFVDKQASPSLLINVDDTGAAIQITPTYNTAVIFK